MKKSSQLPDACNANASQLVANTSLPLPPHNYFPQMPQCNVPPGAGAKLLHALHLHIGHKHKRLHISSDVSVSTSLSTSTCAMCIHMSCATSFIGNTLSCTLSYVLLHARLTISQHLTRCYLASLTVVALSNTSLSYKLHSSHMPSMNIETDFVNKKRNNASTP